MKKEYIPNILTFLRITLIPVIVFGIVTSNFLLSVISFAISGISDILDGYIARKFKFCSSLGSLLDPLADKLTQIFTIGTLTLNNLIPSWIIIVILLKEFIMIIGSSFLYGKDIVVFSKWYGKLATILLFLAITYSLLSNHLNSFISKNLDIYLYSLAILSTILALFAYTSRLIKSGLINKEDLTKDKKHT